MNIKHGLSRYFLIVIVLTLLIELLDCSEDAEDLDVEKRLQLIEWVPIASYPWTAVIQYHYFMFIYLFLCNGALIHVQWVLTASSCFEKRSKDSYIRVIAGTGYLGWLYDSGDHIHYISERIFYSDLPKNDILLIKLSEPFKIVDKKKPVRLTITERQGLNMGHGWVSGFKSITPRGPGWSSYIRHARALLRRMSVCKEKVGEEASQLFICGRDKDAQSEEPSSHILCEGPPGAPLVMHDSTYDPDRKHPLLLGVASKIFGCDGSETFDTYTRIWYYDDWIKEKLLENGVNLTEFWIETYYDLLKE